MHVLSIFAWSLGGCSKLALLFQRQIRILFGYSLIPKPQTYHLPQVPKDYGMMEKGIIFIKLLYYKLH